MGVSISNLTRGADFDEPDQPIAAVQALLRQQRLYSGPVDGVNGKETVAAIRRYQILHSLQATGRLDAATLRVMLAPLPQPSGELSAADRELLRELSQTPIPDPVAESARKPIPPADPPVVSQENQRKVTDGNGKKASRSKPVRHRRSGSSGLSAD